MDVIIRLKKKKYYTSKVFGIYKESSSKEVWDTFYIVFDEKKEKLIKIDKYKTDKYIETMVLELNQNIDDMLLDEEGFGHIDFLTDDDIIKVIEGKSVSKDKLSKCKKISKDLDLNKYIEVNDDEDINNLLLLTCYFHDSYIENINGNDKKMSITFDKIWGMKLEIILEDEVTYKNSLGDDIYWYDCSIVKNESDYFVLVNQSDYDEEDDIDQYSCYFMAKKMKYKIMPE